MIHDSFYNMEPISDFSSFSWISFIPWIVGGIIIFILIFIGIRWLVKGLRRQEFYGMSREEIQKRWKDIEQCLKRGDEMSWKLALMEADKLLDYALKSRGFGGQTMGERLKLAAYKYPKIRDVWHAHLTRNKLVHEASFHLSFGQAKGSIASFKHALEQLGVL